MAQSVFWLALLGTVAENTQVTFDTELASYLPRSRRVARARRASAALPRRETDHRNRRISTQTINFSANDRIRRTTGDPRIAVDTPRVLFRLPPASTKRGLLTSYNRSNFPWRGSSRTCNAEASWSTPVDWQKCRSNSIGKCLDSKPKPLR